MRYPGFVPTINLRLPVLSLTLFAHCYPSQTLLWLNIYQKLFSTHMHNWLLLYICRKNTYQSALFHNVSLPNSLHFHSLRNRKYNVLVYKAVNNLAPVYLKELLYPYVPCRGLPYLTEVSSLVRGRLTTIPCHLFLSSAALFSW